MNFTFRIPPLSKKERKRRETSVRSFIGQWSISSDFPLQGILTIKSDGKKYSGSFATGEGIQRQDIKLKQFQLSGENIAFVIGSADNHFIHADAGRLLFFGQLQKNLQQIDGKLHAYTGKESRKYKEFIWTAVKTSDS